MRERLKESKNTKIPTETLKQPASQNRKSFLRDRRTFSLQRGPSKKITENAFFYFLHPDAKCPNSAIITGVMRKRRCRYIRLFSILLPFAAAAPERSSSPTFRVRSLESTNSFFCGRKRTVPRRRNQFLLFFFLTCLYAYTPFFIRSPDDEAPRCKYGTHKVSEKNKKNTYLRTIS